MKIKLSIILFFVGVSITGQAQKDIFMKFGNHLNWLIAAEYDNNLKDSIPEKDWHYNLQLKNTNEYTKNSLKRYLVERTKLYKICQEINSEFENKITTYDKKDADKLIIFAVSKLIGDSISKYETFKTDDLISELENHYNFDENDKKHIKDGIDKYKINKNILKLFNNNKYCAAYKIIIENQGEYKNDSSSDEIKKKCTKKKKQELDASIVSENISQAKIIFKELKELNLLNPDEIQVYNDKIGKIKGTSNSIFWWILAMLLTIVFFAVLSYYFYDKMMKYKELVGGEKETLIKQNKQLSFDKENLIKKHKKEIGERIRNYNSLESNFKRLKQELKNEKLLSVKGDEEISYKNEEMNVKITSNKSSSKIIKYLSMSSPDGIFIKEHDRIKSGQTYFKLTISPNNPKRGEFEAISTDKYIIKSLLQNIRDYLKPVCEIENEHIDNPTAIRTLKPGTAIYIGRNWKMENKSVVKLI